MPAGTPRGFNLQQFGFGGIPHMQGFGGQGGLPPFVPGQIPAVWSNNGDRGGPMRRGNNNGRPYQNSARTGPYDRRPQDPRFNRDSGRLSPPPGSRPNRATTGAGRWGDGAAGGAAVGPREAVQGRSLKSYEDLDAVAGGGAGELNY